MLYTSKIILKIAVIITLITTAVNFISCKDDPVSNDPPVGDTGIDTVAMYEWNWDTINGHLLDEIFVVDSNNIFIVGNSNNMMYYDGETYTPISYNDPTFHGKTIAGYNQNNIFITGSRYTPSGPAKPCLKVWDGVSFSTYEFPNDSGDGLGEVMVIGYNQGWFSNTLYNIYYFDNGNFLQYRLNDIIGGGGFYRSQANDVYLFSSRIGGVFDPPYINTGYKYINNSFEVIYVDTSTTSTNMSNTYFPSYPFYFRGGFRAINIFTNDNWTLLCNTYNFNPDGVCATSIDSVFCYGQGGAEYGNSLFLWNGIKWELESNFYHLFYGGPRKFPPAGVSSQLSIVNRKIYLNFNNYNNNSSYLLIGKPMHRKEAVK